MEGPLFLLSERIDFTFNRCVSLLIEPGRRHTLGSQAHELGSWLARLPSNQRLKCSPECEEQNQGVTFGRRTRCHLYICGGGQPMQSMDESNRESLLEIALLKLIGEGSMQRPSPEVVQLLRKTGILKDVDYGLVSGDDLLTVYDYQSQPMQDNLHSRRARADLLWLVPYCGQLSEVIQIACDVVQGLKPPIDLEVAVKAFIARERGEGEPNGI